VETRNESKKKRLIEEKEKEGKNTGGWSRGKSRIRARGRKGLQPQLVFQEGLPAGRGGTSISKKAPSLVGRRRESYREDTTGRDDCPREERRIVARAPYLLCAARGISIKSTKGAR